MSYVIKNLEGQYVAASRMYGSYTVKLEHAKFYPSKAAADRDRIKGKETAVPVEGEKNANS